MTQDAYQMIGTVLNDGMVTIKADIRKLLDISRGDVVQLTVKKIASGKKETKEPEKEIPVL